MTMPKLISWNDRSFYDIHRDEHIARVSGWDDRHQEHWMIVETGKGYAARRTAAVERIMSAIEEGHEPGEVE
jgi:hypothetical protein